MSAGHYPRILVCRDEVAIQRHAHDEFHIFGPDGHVEVCFTLPGGNWVLHQPADVAFSEGHEAGFYEGRKSA